MAASSAGNRAKGLGEGRRSPDSSRFTSWVSSIMRWIRREASRASSSASDSSDSPPKSWPRKNSRFAWTTASGFLMSWSRNWITSCCSSLTLRSSPRLFSTSTSARLARIRARARAAMFRAHSLSGRLSSAKGRASSLPTAKIAGPRALSRATVKRAPRRSQSTTHSSCAAGSGSSWTISTSRLTGLSQAAQRSAISRLGLTTATATCSASLGRSLIAGRLSRGPGVGSMKGPNLPRWLNVGAGAKSRW